MVSASTFPPISAEFDNGGQNLILSGGVNLTTASGYRIQTEALQAALGQTRVDKHRPGAGHRPLSANWMPEISP